MMVGHRTARLRPRHRTATAITALALVAAACGGDDGTGDDGDVGAADDGVATDVGVTDEPCPEPVNEDNGCIYLGLLTDLTGVFAAVGTQSQAGMQAFWQRVNEDGGIGGYDIDIDANTRNTEYNPQTHAELFAEIEPEILAVAQSLGTPHTEAILPDMIANDIVGVPGTFWSGWAFDEVDEGVLLESGYSYCLESVIGLDWSAANEGDIASVQAVGFPGDYGGDVAAGAERWAEANDADWLGFVETGPTAQLGSQDAALQQVLAADADRVVLAVSPVELAEIVGGAVAQGFEGRFLGSVPTWAPQLLGTPAADALVATFTLLSPAESFGGSSDAHVAMQEALDGGLPDNDYFTLSWIGSYPLKAALEAAAEAGDLTRAGVRAAADGLTVDFEGAGPEVTYTGDAAETVSRTGTVSQIDSDAPFGLATIEDQVSAPTAEALEYTAPCIGT